MTEPISNERYFLGGRDLEMLEITRLLRRAGAEFVDRGLAWGACASAYRDEIERTLSDGDTVVLVELADDLTDRVDRSRIVAVDHHGDRAGRDLPSALRQVFDRLRQRCPSLRWTRRMALVAANDIGHAAGLRAVGASADEVTRIRDDDRKAQGVTAEIEAESRRAIGRARTNGQLIVVETTAPTSSAVADFMLPEYGGPGPKDLLVVMPESFAFFGRGPAVRLLSKVEGSWYGGDLPARGYWGTRRASSPDPAKIEALALGALFD